MNDFRGKYCTSMPEVTPQTLEVPTQLHNACPMTRDNLDPPLTAQCSSTEQSKVLVLVFIYEYSQHRFLLTIS